MWSQMIELLNADRLLPHLSDVIQPVRWGYIALPPIYIYVVIFHDT